MSLPCFAAETSTPEIPATGGKTHEVSVKTFGGGTVYSVDIAWGSMEFVYKKDDWDYTTHTYKKGYLSAAEEGSNTIKVTNHSNAEVIVKATPTIEETGRVLTGSISYNNNNDTSKMYYKPGDDRYFPSEYFVIPAGEVNKVDEAPKAEFSIKFGYPGDLDAAYKVFRPEDGSEINTVNMGSMTLSLVAELPEGATED